MQIIAREVELEIMRRITPRNTESSTDKNRAKNKPKEFKKPNHLQRLETKPIKATETVRINKFHFRKKNTIFTFTSHKIINQNNISARPFSKNN